MPYHRVAVITPYYKEPAGMLAQCHESVRRQGVDADHFMIADGHPLDAIDGWAVSHVKLPGSHDDNGNTPRGIGGLLAAREGYDFIAYLDADNWFHDGHLRSLLQLWEQRSTPVCASLRSFHDEDGVILDVQEADEDEGDHIDTSCILLHRSGFDCLSIWLAMPAILAPICDRVFVGALRHRQLAISSTGARSVAFRTRYRLHYEAANRLPPPDAKGGDVFTGAFDYLLTSHGVSECVSQLGFWPGSYLRTARAVPT